MAGRGRNGCLLSAQKLYRAAYRAVARKMRQRHSPRSLKPAVKEVFGAPGGDKHPRLAGKSTPSPARRA